MSQRFSFYRFLQIIFLNNGLSSKGIIHTIPWLVKTILLEPVRWMELAKYQKAIKSHQIVHQPLFILGHYRSGTTFLQRMFVQDKRFGYTSMVQTVFPEIMLTSEKKLTPVLDKFCQTFRVKNPFHRTAMEWKEFPGEEDVAMTALLQYTGSQWGQLFPRSFEKYFEECIVLQPPFTDRWKQDYLYLLKKISLNNCGKSLVLKNPPNTARIKVLLELFPNAKFIHIVRDPFEVFASTKRLFQIIDRHYQLGKKNQKTNEELILYSYSAIMDQYLLQKELIPAQNLVEISYEEFIQNPLNTVRCIYSRLQLFDFAECEQAMKDFVIRQKSYKVLHHEIDEKIRDLISKKWEKHIQYWQNLKPVAI